MGKKIPLNGVRKCDGQTDIQTFLLIERMGPEGRFFEKEFEKGGSQGTRIRSEIPVYFC